MLVIPAIDIRDGKCVRLFRGDFSKETIFSEHPLKIAQKWENVGAQYLHIVDLDGALSGKLQNLALIKKIIDAVHIPVEVGGGIRDIESIEKILSCGAARVVLGSSAVKNPAFIEQACSLYGEKIAVSIDARSNVVVVDGWAASGNMTAVALAEKMALAGVKTIIYTDIARDGTLLGINLEAVADLARRTKLKIIAAGGLSSLDEIEALKQYEKDGIVGVIAGKAAYTGALDMKKAIDMAS